MRRDRRPGVPVEFEATVMVQTEVTVTARYHEGEPATRTDPGAPGWVEIESVTDASGTEVELAAGELAAIEEMARERAAELAESEADARAESIIEERRYETA